RDPSKSHLMLGSEQRTLDSTSSAFNDKQNNAIYGGFNPYPSPPAATATYQTHQLPIAQQFSSSSGSLDRQEQTHYFSQPISQAPSAFQPLQAAYLPSSTSNSAPISHFHAQQQQYYNNTRGAPHPKHAPSHLPPPPKMPLPAPPPAGFPLHYQDQYHQDSSLPINSSSSLTPPTSQRLHSLGYQPQSPHLASSPPYHQHSPISPSSPAAPTLHSMYSQSGSSQNIDNTVFSLHASLSSLSLAPSVHSSGGHPELTRVGSNTSASSGYQRPLSVASRISVPVTSRTVMELKTAEVLASLAFEDIPRCYVIAPPSITSTVTGQFTPFRIMAPCQALGVSDQGKEHPIHFPDHPGYPVNNAEEMMKAHGTVLQHFANLAWLVSGATDPSFGRGLSKHAEKFLKVVKPTSRVPANKDTLETATGVEGSSLHIEKFMVEHLQMESIAKLMEDITGSNQATDWYAGLQRMVSPGTGRAMWVCPDCFSGLQSGRYVWNDEQASLDDLIGFPDKSGVKSEAQLLNAEAVETYTQMIRGQSRMKHVVVHLSPAYFELPERKVAAVFSANQRLIQNLTKTLTEAHLTVVEINGNQARESSELMDKDNIYLHVRRLFACYSIEVMKLSGLPFLLREKLPGFLNHAKYITFDGVLVDNDKAVTNMKKLIAENSDMEHLVLTRAHMTSTGLKVLCSAHKNLRRLHKLDLSRNRLDTEGIKELANNVLPTSLDLRILDVSHNPNIGTNGCIALQNAIWPKSSHATKQKNLISLQMANIGFCDEAAQHLSRNIEGPQGIGALFNLNLSANVMTKTGLTVLMSVISRNATSSTLRKISLGQQSNISNYPGFMDPEVVHYLGTHSTLTHLTLTKVSLSILAQIVNLNKSLVSLVVDDTVCVSSQDPNYALSSFNSLCHSIASNTTLHDLKVRTPWSFWALAFQSMASSMSQDSQWEVASGWMAIMESSLQRNTIMRCFQMRGITNFEEELLASTAAAGSVSGAGSINGGSVGRHGSIAGMSGSDVARTEGEVKMLVLSQGIRAMLERNQVMHYGRKHGLESQLAAEY
ncbi:hypothetical protein BGZ50_009083, partial [Haplosporangium sp. Z 11]